MAAPTRILHATDFSPAGASAFAHALRIALDTKGKLYLLHVENESPHWSEYPHVREILARWGLLDPHAPRSAVEALLGVQVTKVAVASDNLRKGVVEFAVRHKCDLLVLSTHARHGLKRWFESSVAEDVSRELSAPTLFVPEAARGFVDAASGRAHLGSVVVPLDGVLDCMPALRRIDSVLQPFGAHAKVELLHVGAQAPVVRDETGAVHDLPVRLRQGLVVESILSFADEVGANLIAMPTEGRHGFFDALRGSTTERVLRGARTPVLAAPVG